mgnify:CR=1 FL=1
MAFKSFERSTLVLGMTVLSTLGVAKTHAQISEVPAAPANPVNTTQFKKNKR